MEGFLTLPYKILREPTGLPEIQTSPQERKSSSAQPSLYPATYTSRLPGDPRAGLHALRPTGSPSWEGAAPYTPSTSKTLSRLVEGDPQSPLLAPPSPRTQGPIPKHLPRSPLSLHLLKPSRHSSSMHYLSILYAPDSVYKPSTLPYYLDPTNPDTLPSP